MSNVAIAVDGLGKRYRIGARPSEPYGSLRESLMQAATAPLRRLRHVGRGDAATRDVWALQDVSFEVKHGEAVGIIGRNGAGKSTLLKLLSRITEPTAGRAIVHGRVGSLLEVGTGFHPELTGRENIYLNGAVMGMSRADIKRRFDEIVDFSGVETYLDTPVKRYSSGMYMRLAFAVAAHLEPEVLVIDEVLAVGDAQFQKKCLRKMEDVAKNGRTVLFVSHNMPAISTLCRRAVVLGQGRIVCDDVSQQAIMFYLGCQGTVPQAALVDRLDRQGDGRIRFTKAWVEDAQGNPIDTACSGQEVRLVAEYQAADQRPLGSLSVAFALNSSLAGQLTDLWSEGAGAIWEKVPSCGKVVCRLPRLPLNAGRYSFNVCGRVNTVIADAVLDAVPFDVVPGDFFGTGRLPSEDQGCFLLDQQWILEN